MSNGTQPPVLELRIHGVSNTPPPNMLDLPADGIVQVEGDDLGSFWQPRPEALAGLTEADRGYVPPGIQREAYSWGGLARTSIGGTSAIGTLLNAAGRLGWSLLIPFGLVNVAYWSRRLGEIERDTKTASETATGPAAQGGVAPAPPARPLTWRSLGGGASLRLAGLLLTLLGAITAGVLSLDYLGVQCFSSTVQRCTSLPDWAGFLYSWSLSRRLALLSLVPLLVTVFLWFLASRSRTRYERATRDQTYGEGSAKDADAARTPDASRARPHWPLLSTPGFWNHSVISGATATLHLSAVTSYLALAAAWHMHFGALRSCGTFRSIFSSACRADAAGSSALAGSLWVIGVALVLLVVVVLLVLVRTEDAADIAGPDRSRLNRFQRALRSGRAVRAVAVAAAALFALQVVFLYAADVSLPPPTSGSVTAAAGRTAMVGLGTDVLIALAILVGLGLSALSWRYVRAPYAVAGGVAGAALLLASGWPESATWQWVFRGLAAVAFLATVVPVFTVERGQDGPRRRYEMFGGCAPGVFLLLGTLLAFTLSSAFVVTVGNILNGNLPPASLAGVPQAPTQAVGGGCDQQCDPHVDFPLTAPQAYVWFGGLLVVVLAGAVLAVLVALGLQWRGGRRRPLPALPAPEPKPLLGEYRSMRGGHLEDAVPNGPLAKAVLDARALARHAHRAEKALAMLTYAATIALVGSVSSVLAPGTVSPNGLLAGLMSWGMWALIGVGVLVIGLATGTGGPGGSAGGRPLGLFWDLICFLPRAGHPFGPPCYAERVVPELLGRYRWWLTEEGRLPDDLVGTGPRRIVLSAHSLGSVLAVATVLGARGPGQPGSPVGSLSLVTYGTQLRAYFARLFPELLGPEVLGVPPCRAADGTTPDPWWTERRDTKPEPTTYDGSVRALLGGDTQAPGRWLSLWHLTDPLGFPVHHYPPRPEDTAYDRYAEEVDRTAYLLTPLGHSDYPRTVAYARAVQDLSGVPWVP